MILDRDSQAAKEHPLIKEFVDLVDETAKDGVLSFADLTTSPFMKFWRYLVIYEFEPELTDFRVRYWGSHPVTITGNDWTGKLLSEMGYMDSTEEIHVLNMEALEKRKRIFASGNLHWQSREHIDWNQVKMPLCRGESINEVLLCLVFERPKGDTRFSKISVF